MNDNGVIEGAANQLFILLIMTEISMIKVKVIPPAERQNAAMQLPLPPYSSVFFNPLSAKMMLRIAGIIFVNGI